MTKNSKLPGFATRAIHVGQEPDLESGAVSAPIHPTSTYVQQEIGKNKGYEYARVSNPTRTRLEENLASLEGGASAHVFSSGMAAIAALVTMLKTGDHVIVTGNPGRDPNEHRIRLHKIVRTSDGWTWEGVIM